MREFKCYSSPTHSLTSVCVWGVEGRRSRKGRRRGGWGENGKRDTGKEE